MRKLKWLLAVMLPVWPLMLLAVISGVLTIGSNIALLAVAAWLIATAAFHPPLSELSLAIVGVRFFGLARAGLRYAERYLSHEATFRILSQVRVYVYKVSEAAFSANLALFHDGALLDRLVSDVETLQYFFLRVFAPLLTALIAGTAVSLVFAGYAAGLAGIFLTMAVGSLAVSFMLYRLQQWRAVAVPVSREELKSSFLDVFSGLEELTAIDGQLVFEERLYAAGAALTKAQERTAVLTAAFDFAGNLASSAAVWLALLFVAMAAGQGACGSVNAAVLVIMMQSSMEIIAPFFLLPYHWHDSALAAERIDELVGQRTEYGQAVERRPPVLSPELCWEFHGVSFAYRSGQQPVLREVSLCLPAGGKVAVVGESGAGKTTLLKVLLGQWDYQGSIFLNGQELRQFSPEAIHNLCSVVSQDSYLFCATISDNLRLARPSAGHDELVAAAAKAGISQFIEELPDGYETLVGQQGMTLSGGQRRRLTIARALLKDAPLLVLDEPCAGLDNITAQAVMRKICQSAAGRSLLLVTHRLQELASMDEIIVMEHGRIAERGTQTELLARTGVFYRLWRVQNDLL